MARTAIWFTVKLVMALFVVQGQHDVRASQQSDAKAFDLVFPNNTVGSSPFTMKRVTGISPLQAFTVCFWFNTTAKDKYHVHLDYVNSADVNEVHVASSSIGAINEFYVYINGKQRKFNASESFHEGVWHHFCSTWDGTNGEVRVYMDGETQRNSQEYQPIVTTLNIEGSLYVGKETSDAGPIGNGRNFIGQMSRINLWNSLLSTNTIMRMSNSCEDSEEGNVVLWSSFKDDPEAKNISVRESTCPIAKGRDCVELLHKGYKRNGFYLINPDNNGYFSVMCDQQTNGGGWVIIQRRMDGSVNFHENWDSYNIGFGNPNGEFWLGNNRIKRTVSIYHELLIELQDSTNDTGFVLHQIFIKPQKNFYRLEMPTNHGQGTAGSMLYSGIYFSTYDRGYKSNYAADTYYGGGFWIHGDQFNLNARYSGNHKIRWYSWKRSHSTDITNTEMKLRPIRERDINYGLSFGEKQDNSYILFQNVKGFKDVTVCAWLKVQSSERHKCIFSMFNDNQRFQICVEKDLRQITIILMESVQVIVLNEIAFNPSEWTPFCFARHSSGMWDFYLREQKVQSGFEFERNLLFQDGSLIIGQKVDNQSSWIDADSSFVGHITQFSIWPTYHNYFTGNKISSFFGGCSEDYGAIPWTEAYLWIHGNITKHNVFLCESFKVGHTWTLARSGAKVFQDESGVFSDAVMKRNDKYNVSTDLNVFSNDEKSCVNLIDNKFFCLTNPSQCLGGFTLSFWLKYGEMFISRILDKRTEDRKQLEQMFSPVIGDFSKFSLCYRASKHGWDPKIFHLNCDNKTSTLTIVKVKDYVFGGYIDHSWGGAEQNMSSQSAFLFSLNNPEGCPPFKLKIKTEFTTKAGQNNIYSGPVFGLNDLYVGAVSFSDLGQAYDLSNLTCDLSIGITQERARKLLAGSYYFLPDEIEVFEYVVPQFPSYILSSGDESKCGVFFKYENEKEFELSVKLTDKSYHLSLPALKSFNWSRITIAWSEMNGLRLDQDNIFHSDNFRVEYNNPRTNCPSTYTFTLGCSTTVLEQNITHSSNLQLTDLQVYDTVFTRKEVQENIKWKKDFFKTGEILNAARLKQITSFFAKPGVNGKIVDGFRRIHYHYCFWVRTNIPESWWEVDLVQKYIVTDIFIAKMLITDFKNFKLTISNEPGGRNGSSCGGLHSFEWQTHGRFVCEHRPVGRFLRISLKTKLEVIVPLCEVEVRGLLFPGYWLVNSSYPRYKGEKFYYRTNFVLSMRNCLTFYYIINGTNSGRLNVHSGGYQGKTTLLWRLAGDQGSGDAWSMAQVPISEETAFQVIFEAVVGKPYEGYIAVDNITLSTEQSCKLFPPSASNTLSGIASKLIQHLPSYQDWLMSAVSQVGFANRYWVPCYHALTDGWNTSVFHYKCLGKGPMIVLVRRGSQVFGGFSDVNYKDFVESSKNYALGRPTEQKLTDLDFQASNAVDGNNKTYSISMHTSRPWWRVELEHALLVRKVTIYNHEDQCCRDDLHNFEIQIRNDLVGEVKSLSKCGGLHSLKDMRKKSFDCVPTIYGKYVTIQIINDNVALTLGEVEVYGYRRPIPSTKAFLYRFNDKNDANVGDKLKMLPDKNPSSVFFTYDGVIFGSKDLEIRITERIVYNTPGGSYERLPDNKPFTGNTNFKPDDLEVLLVGDTLCDPPCLKGEQCDEILSKCVCDFSRRDYEQCLERRELQNKRDQFCRNLRSSSDYYARYDRKMDSTVGKKWRCYHQEALTGDRKRYNTTELSKKLYTHKQKLTAMENEYPRLAFDVVVEHMSMLYWPLDNYNDLECIKTGQWGSNVFKGEPVRGVIDGGLMLNGTSGEAIQLPVDVTLPHCLFNPNGCNNGLAISLWIKYFLHKNNSGSQVFFSTLSTSQDRGFVIYQINSSFSHIAVDVVHDTKHCTKVVEFHKGIWTHLAVVYQNINSADLLELYVSGVESTSIIQEGCTDSIYPDVQNRYVTIGQNDIGAPNATIDDIVIVLDAKAYKDRLSNMYKYYEGGPNLYLKASFVLTKERWAEEILNKDSDIYRGITTDLKQNISNANIKNTIKSQEITFWKKEDLLLGGYIGCHMLIGFNGRGFSQMADVVLFLEQMAGITELKLSSNDVYVKGPQPEEYLVYGNTVKIKLKWNKEDKELSHGILNHYTLFYVNTLDPSDKGHVKVLYDEGNYTIYNLTGLKYFTQYEVSVRADTLEGEGRVSESVNITTGTLAPTQPPPNVESWNLSSTSIAIRWAPIPDINLKGPVIHYKIKVQLVDQPKSLKTKNVSENETIVTGLKKYGNYSVQVAGISLPFQVGPFSESIYVITDQDVPEMAPSNLTGKPNDATSFTVRWAEIPADKRNGIIIGYTLFLHEEGSVFAPSRMTLPMMPLSFIMRGLKVFTYYQVAILGYTVKGSGPYSQLVRVKTGEGIPDASPNLTAVHNTSSTTLLVKWEPLPEKHWNGILKGYVIYVSKEDNTFVKLVYYNCTIPNVTVTGLSKYQGYEIKIAAFNSAGRGNFSLPVFAFTDEDKPESIPKNITKLEEESNAVALSWEPPANEKSNGIILGYIITLKDLLREKTSNITVNTTTQHRIQGLFPYTDYEITIKAFTSKGPAINDSAIIRVKTKQGAPSGSPTNVIVEPSTTSSSSITISWDPVDRFKANGIVTAYVVIQFELLNPETTRRNTTIRMKSSRRRKRAVSGGTMSTQLSGLRSYTQYGVQILAVTNANGVPSVVFNVTTDEDVPSHPPANLTAHNTSSTSLSINWSEVPKEHKNGIILGYKIRYGNKLTGYTNKTVTDGTKRHTDLTGLEKYNLYKVQILAFTIKGDGNFSEPVYARTAEALPEGVPINVSSSKPTYTTLTIQWQVMPVNQENGIIKGYHVDLFEMNGAPRASVTVNEGNNLLSTVISQLSLWTNYTVKVRAFNSVGPGPWSFPMIVTTDEQAPQDTPSNVTAHFLNSTSIRVNWTLIDQSLTRGIARGYRVYYRALNTPFNRPLLSLTVGRLATRTDLTNLYKYVVYSIYVVALTNKEGNASAVVTTSTDEDKPDRPPQTLIHTLPNPTSIWLGWDEVRDGYKNGIIRGYKMSFRDTTKSDPPTIITFLPDTFSKTLSGLDSYVDYEITLLAFTVKGDGAAITQIIKTDENRPSMSPKNFTAESHTTIDTLPLSWLPIPPNGLPGILRGYRLWYTPVSTGDYDIEDPNTKEIRIPADKTSIVLTGLEIFTRYRVQLSGYTVKGDGPLSITFGETCRCKKRLSSSWLNFPPYVDTGNGTSLAGIMPSIIQQMVVSCCQPCKSHGLSYLDLARNGYNNTAKKTKMEELKIHIDGVTDILFPIPGYQSQELYKSPYGFVGLVGTPGIAFVFSTTSTDGIMVRQMTSSILENWSLILFSLLFAFITGCFIWFLECRKNEEQFPKSFTKGSMEGFWFTFVSMTTVGYGDRCPSSVAGRIVAIAWTLFGVVLTGIIVGNIATALFTVSIKQGGGLYGLKTGAMKNSFEYRFGIRRNARMNEEREYESYDEIYEDLVNQRIEGALVDTFAIGSRRDLFEKKFLRVMKIYDINLARGVVTTGNSTKLNRCFRRFTRSRAKMISDSIKDNVRTVEVDSEPLSTELSSGIFDANNPMFLRTLAALCVLLGVFGLVGIVWELFSFKRSVFLNKTPDYQRLQLLQDTRKGLRLTTEKFSRRLSKVVKLLQNKHKQERLQIKMNHATKHTNHHAEQASEISSDGKESFNKDPRFSGSETELVKDQIAWKNAVPVAWVVSHSGTDQEFV